MKSAAEIRGRAMHPMLVTLPIGGFVLTLIFDLVYMATGDLLWWDATRPVLLVSVIGAAIAAVPGLVDFTTIVPPGGVKKIALTHMGLNTLVVLLMGANAWLRWQDVRGGVDNGRFDPETGLLLSVIGVALLGASGLLGWKMVQTHHVGVLEPGEGGEPVMDARRTGGRTRLHDAVTQP